MSASTASTSTIPASTRCRKCAVAERMEEGDECLTPVAAHAPDCPNGAGEEDEPCFSFLECLECPECHNQEEWRKAYQAWEADNSLDLPCPGAPRVHTCGR